MSPKVFLDSVIRPALTAINKHSPAAEQLMLGTAVQESDLIHLFQVPSGPGRGYFQMEQETHDDIWTTYFNHKKKLSAKVLAVAKLPTGKGTVDLLTTNHQYAAAMARVRYSRVPDPLPPAGDVAAMAKFWGVHYNTRNEDAMIQQFITKWNKRKLSDAFG